MKSWKLMLSLGVACAACCALPLLGVAGGLAAFASALWACADEFIPAAVVLSAIAVSLAGLWWWQRRRGIQSSSCGCATTCSTGGEHANG